MDAYGPFLALGYHDYLLPRINGAPDSKPRLNFGFLGVLPQMAMGATNIDG